MHDPVQTGPQVGCPAVGLDAAEVRPPAFRRELTPTWLRVATLLAGTRPPGDVLRVVDLRCRRGVTAAVIAAAHPSLEIFAADVDPSNLDATATLARAAGLENMIVDDAEVSALRQRGGADIVLLDDVVTTIEAAERDRLGEVIAQVTRPGGLITVSYRTMAGWSELVPVHRFARLLDRYGPSDPRARAGSVLRMLEQMRAAGPRTYAIVPLCPPGSTSWVSSTGSSPTNRWPHLRFARCHSPTSPHGWRRPAATTSAAPSWTIDSISGSPSRWPRHSTTLSTKGFER